MVHIKSKVFEHKGKYYFADKSFVPSVGVETMIFASDAEGNVTDWEDLYCDTTNKTLETCIEEFKRGSV